MSNQCLADKCMRGYVAASETFCLTDAVSVTIPNLPTRGGGGSGTIIEGPSTIIGRCHPAVNAREGIMNRDDLGEAGKEVWDAAHSTKWAASQDEGAVFHLAKREDEAAQLYRADPV